MIARETQRFDPVPSKPTGEVINRRSEMFQGPMVD